MEINDLEIITPTDFAPVLAELHRLIAMNVDNLPDVSDLTADTIQEVDGPIKEKKPKPTKKPKAKATPRTH